MLSNNFPKMHQLMKMPAKLRNAGTEYTKKRKNSWVMISIGAHFNHSLIESQAYAL